MKACRENQDFVEIGQKYWDILNGTEVLIFFCSRRHQTTIKSIPSSERYQAAAMVQKFKGYAKVPKRYANTDVTSVFQRNAV
jgi:hypothetical protein